MSGAVRYIGENPCPVVRDGERPIMKGDVISASADVLAYYLSRTDFESIESADAPKTLEHKPEPQTPAVKSEE